MIANQQYIFPVETESVRLVQASFGGDASISCVARCIATGDRLQRSIGGDTAYPVVARVGEVHAPVPGDR